LARKIRDACAAIKAQLGIRRGQREGQTASTPAAARKQWVEKWIGQPAEQRDEREKPKVLQDWKAGCTEDSRRAERIVQAGTDPGG
jgi:hypothetical protein